MFQGIDLDQLGPLARRYALDSAATAEGLDKLAQMIRQARAAVVGRRAAGDSDTAILGQLLMVPRLVYGDDSAEREQALALLECVAVQLLAERPDLAPETV